MSEPEVPPVEWLLKARVIKHQMSNIMMGLLGHTELLGEHPDLPERSRQKVQLIYDQICRLQGQVDALNELCRTDTD